MKKKLFILVLANFVMAAVYATSLLPTPLSHFFELIHARPSSRGRFGAGAR